MQPFLFNEGFLVLGDDFAGDEVSRRFDKWLDKSEDQFKSSKLSFDGVLYPFDAPLTLLSNEILGTAIGVPV